MRFAKSANFKSFSESILNKNANAEDKTALSFKEERLDLEQKAMDHEKSRMARKANFPNIPTSLENKPIHKAVASDQHFVVEKASKTLKSFLSDVVGKGGYTIESEDFRSRKAHNDTVTDEVVTDTALMSFAVKFELPGLNKFRTAKFIVAFDEANDEPYRVENVFYDEKEVEHALTSGNLDKFLANANLENDMSVKSEKPMVWYNPEAETYEKLEVKEAMKTASRLQASGFNIEDNFWVDTSYDPKNFGRLCMRVDVPLTRIAEFKKITAMTDDEWFNRGSEGGKDYKDGKAWTERALDGSKEHKIKEWKDGKEWSERGLEDGKENSKKDYGNPYNSESKMMFDYASKKPLEAAREEAVKKALESKEVKASDTLSDKINKLNDLLK